MEKKIESEQFKDGWDQIYDINIRIMISDICDNN